MTISSVGSTILPQLLNTAATSSVTNTSAPDNAASTGGTAAAGSSRLGSAITQALTSIGVTPADTTSSSAPTGTASNPDQSMQAFTQALFSALQGSGTSSSSNSSQAPNPQAAAAHGHHHGGGGKVAGGLQSLIQQLGSTGSASSTATPASGSGTLANLQTAFDNLVSANGGTSGSSSLSSFLQSLSQNLNGAPASGNVVSTSA